MHNWLSIFPIRQALAGGFLLLFAACLPAQNLTYEQEDYVDSIFLLALENRIVIYDTLLRPVSNKIFREKHLRYDTVINDQWTRPRYIDNVYHGHFDGVAVLRKPLLDSVTWKKNRRYVEFREYVRDDEGNPVGIKTAFILNGPADTIAAKSVAKQLRRKLKSTPALFQKYKRIVTARDEYWTIKTVEHGAGAPAPADSCQQLYRLRLGKDLRFEQSYRGHPTCATADMAPDVHVGVEDNDGDRFFAYYARVMGCYIRHPSGWWTLEGNELVLLTPHGREVGRYTLEQSDGKTLRISMPYYKVNLVKNIPKYMDKK